VTFTFVTFVSFVVFVPSSWRVTVEIVRVLMDLTRSRYRVVGIERIRRFIPERDQEGVLSVYSEICRLTSQLVPPAAGM
jgi:hypothetical protein